MRKRYPAGSDSPLVPRFFNKPQEIITDSNTSDNLLGFPSRLSIHDDITSDRQKRQNSRLLSPPACFSKYHITKPSLIGLLEFPRSANWRAPLHFQI